MIYLCPDINDFNLWQALAQASPQRREYALRYRQEQDQRRCMAAYQMLRQGLRDGFGIDEVPEFAYDSHGKPLLRDYPSIHFNMSHCREAAVVVIDDKPVGIDIENYDHYSEEVARRVMNEEEMRQILASPHPDVTFTRLWTMKESLYKVHGDDHDGDIAHMLDDTTGVKFFFSHGYPGYYLTACKLMPSNPNNVTDRDLRVLHL